VAIASTDAESADDFCEDCGYEPELKRTLGTFQVFAISFAFISVAGRLRHLRRRGRTPAR
jgi:hypothetical protein